jgi:hypothetical protein
MEPKTAIIMNRENIDCDSVDEEIYSLITHLQKVVHTIMKFHREQKTEELKSFCKKHNSMINFILKINNGTSNVERKKGFEIAVRPYIAC